MTTGPEYIYGMVDLANPDEYLYIGRTKDLTTRLLRHASDALKRPKTKKDKALRGMLLSGAKIDLVVIDEVPAGTLMGLEDLHISNYDPPWNSKGGDSHQFRPKIVKRKAQVATPEMIEKLEWKKNGVGAKRGERFATFNGYQIFRKGWTSSRVRYPGQIEHRVGGMVKEIFLRNLAEHVSPK